MERQDVAHRYSLDQHWGNDCEGNKRQGGEAEQSGAFWGMLIEHQVTGVGKQGVEKMEAKDPSQQVLNCESVRGKK